MINFDEGKSNTTTTIITNVVGIQNLYPIAKNTVRFLKLTNFHFLNNTLCCVVVASLRFSKQWFCFYKGRKCLVLNMSLGIRQTFCRREPAAPATKG